MSDGSLRCVLQKVLAWATPNPIGASMPTAPRWQYAQLTHTYGASCDWAGPDGTDPVVESDKVVDHLNAAGAEGWELHSVDVASRVLGDGPMISRSQSSAASATYTFKREVVPEAPRPGFV